MAHWAARLYLWACERLYYQLAPVYDPVSWLVSAGHWDRWRRLALDYVSGPRVLEVGFGTGELLAAAARRGLEVHGLELSPAMQRVTARKLRVRALDVPRVRALAQAAPYADGSFDAIISTFPARYIFDPASLAEFGRLLRSGSGAQRGRLVIVGAWVRLEQPVLRRLAPLFYGLPPADFLTRYRARMADAGLELRLELREDGVARVPVLIAEQGA